MILVQCGCGAKKETPEADHKPESRVARGTNDEVILRLDAATQKAMGLETDAVKAAAWGREIKGYGRVLDASGLAASAAELKTAEAASQVSQAELTRLKTLASQNNASQRALEAAGNAALRDQAQLEAVRLRLMTTWGESISRRPDLSSFAQTLATLEGALVQINLPSAERVPATLTAVRLADLAETNLIPAQLLGPAPSVDPQFQGRGFLVLVSPNSTHLVPGVSVTGFLSFSGEKEAGVALPANAVIRFNGLAWVYLQTSEETFERRELKLDAPLGQAWFLRRGFQPGDKVVVTGAQQLLSEELKRDEAE